ncbi:MAG: hypothetical protein LKE54_04220 [Prevotella sp.]|jgi:hypothetical protein|nr:hypothetical protein [Prevotella sp.]MCH3994248.1 hypothetical protein [Prevotella sp.]
MKKFIYSIAALAAIVVMGSCSQDSDLTSVKSSSSKVDSVTVSLNLNSGIEVSESSSNMGKSAVNSANTSLTRAAATRAGSTDSNGNFVPGVDEGTTYTAYFVAATTGNGYTEGNIVSIKSGLRTEEGNSVKVPNIAYNIYVTNYSDGTGGTISSLNVGDAFTSAFTEKTIETAAAVTTGNSTSSVKIPLPNTLPAEATTSLYLFGETTTKATTGSTGFSATVNLYTPYAAVAVSQANDIVTGVSYGAADNKTNYETTGTSSTDWYYMYIIADGYLTTVLGPTAGTTKPANYLNGTFNENSSIAYTLNSTSKSITLDNSIKAGTIYQYNVNKGGQLTLTVNAFDGTPITGDLDLDD